MKILVLNYENTSKIEKSDSGHNLIFKEIEDNSVAEIQKSAIFAEEQNCELLAVIPKGVDIYALEEMLKSLPDKDSPTALVTTYQRNDYKPDKKEKRTLLMLQLLTGERICGFRNNIRIYPVKLLNNISEKTFKDPCFYISIFIKAAKAGYKIVSTENKAIPACHSEVSEARRQVCLERPSPSLSYFIPFLLKSLTPWPNKRLCPRNFQKEKAREFFLHPMKFLKYLIKENATPGGLALAAATGMFIGSLPLLGIHTISIIYVSIKLRLNKMLSVNISHLCMPPFVPFACIELGHWFMNGQWLTLKTLENIFKEGTFSAFGSILIEWILGSIIIAPLNALLFAGITYTIASSIKTKITKGHIDSRT